MKMMIGPLLNLFIIVTDLETTNRSQRREKAKIGWVAYTNKWVRVFDNGK